MSDATATPIAVNPSPLADQLKQGLATMVFLLTGFGFLAHFLTPAQAAFVQSSNFIPAVSSLLAGGVIAWRQIEVRIKKKQVVIIADAAPDSVAVVTRRTK